MITRPLWYATLLSGIVLSAAAQYHRPLPRLARRLPAEVIATAVLNAPAGAACSVPAWREMRWAPDAQWIIGDIVRHDRAIYVCVLSHISLADWQPSAVPALWRMVRAPGEGVDDIPAWRQPLGAHDAYQLNDLVIHNGATWRSIIPNNTWVPGVYGWEPHTP